MQWTGKRPVRRHLCERSADLRGFAFFCGQGAVRDVVNGMADGLTVPLAPYMLMRDSGRALGVSAVITLLALAVFGFVKGHFTGVPKLKGAVQTALVGGLAAGVAYLIAKFIA